MFLKRIVFNEVNGFNEAYFMYGEDIDLSMKVLNSGYQNYYFSDTQVIHFKGESTRKNLKYLNHFYDAMKIFYNKHFKLNMVYDFFMKFGIKFWYFLKLFKYNSIHSKLLNCGLVLLIVTIIVLRMRITVETASNAAINHQWICKAVRGQADTFNH